MSLDPFLLEVIACPLCKTPLLPDDPAATLTCAECGRVYPVRDGIPVLLIDAALPGSVPTAGGLE